MRRRSLIATIALMLLGVPAQAAPYLIGFWYGIGEPDDKSQMWVEQFFPNGEFRGQYRTCVKGKPQDLFQTGQWSLAGDSETINILTVNGEPYFRTDPYKFVSYDGHQWKYRYLGNGYVFSAKRVDEKFQIPDCETVS